MAATLYLVEFKLFRGACFAKTESKQRALPSKSISFDQGACILPSTAEWRARAPCLRPQRAHPALAHSQAHPMPAHPAGIRETKRRLRIIVTELNIKLKKVAGLPRRPVLTMLSVAYCWNCWSDNTGRDGAGHAWLVKETPHFSFGT